MKKCKNKICRYGHGTHSFMSHITFEPSTSFLNSESVVYVACRRIPISYSSHNVRCFEWSRVVASEEMISTLLPTLLLHTNFRPPFSLLINTLEQRSRILKTHQTNHLTQLVQRATDRRKFEWNWFLKRNKILFHHIFYLIIYNIFFKVLRKLIYYTRNYLTKQVLQSMY